MPAIIVKGSYQDKAIRFLPPNTTNLLYWGMYGKDVGFTTKNHKDGSTITAIGAPVYPNPNYAVFKGHTNYLKTSVIQVPNMTFICVFKIDTEVAIDLISNYASPGQAGSPASVRGCGLALQVGTASDGKLDVVVNGSVDISGTDTSAPSTILASYPVGTWCCLAGTVNSTTGDRTVYNLTAGTSQVQNNTNPISLGSAALQIGSKVTQTTPPSLNDSNIAMSAIYSDVKTSTELQAIYSQLKTYFSKRGIAI